MPEVSSLSFCNNILMTHVRACCGGGCQTWQTLFCDFQSNCICMTPYGVNETPSRCTDDDIGVVKCSDIPEIPPCSAAPCSVFEKSGYDLTLFHCPGLTYYSDIPTIIEFQSGIFPGFGQLIPGLTHTIKCSSYDLGSCSGSYLNCACLTRNRTMVRNLQNHATYTNINNNDTGPEICGDASVGGNPFSPGDANGDGIVNGADLAAVLAGWGTNNPALELNVEYPYSLGVGGFIEFVGPSFRTISTGSSHILAIGGWSGGVYATGDNTSGQCNVPEFLRDPNRISGAIEVSANNKNSSCLYISEYAYTNTTNNLIKNASRMSLGITGWGDNTYNQLPIPTTYQIIRGGYTAGIMLLNGFTLCSSADPSGGDIDWLTGIDSTGGMTHYACFSVPGVTETVSTNYTRVTSGKYNTAALYDNSRVQVDRRPSGAFLYTQTPLVGVECWGDIDTIIIPGISMNNCGTSHGGNGCTCNPGSLDCSAADCGACSALVDQFYGNDICAGTGGVWNQTTISTLCYERANVIWNMGVLVTAAIPNGVTIGTTHYPAGSTIPSGIACGTTGPGTPKGNTYTPCFDNQIKYINDAIIPFNQSVTTAPYAHQISCGTTHCCISFGNYNPTDDLESATFLYCWGTDGTTASLNNVLSPSPGSTMYAWNTSYGAGLKNQMGIFIKENETSVFKEGTFNPAPRLVVGNHTLLTSATITLVSGITHGTNAEYPPVGLTFDKIQNLGVIHSAKAVCGKLFNGAVYNSNTTGSWEWISCGDTNTCATLKCRTTRAAAGLPDIIQRKFMCWGISGDVNNETYNSGNHITISEQIKGTAFDVEYAPCQVAAGTPPVFYYRSIPFAVGSTGTDGDILITAKVVSKVNGTFTVNNSYGDLIIDPDRTTQYYDNHIRHNLNSLLSNEGGVIPTDGNWNQYFSEKEQFLGKRNSDTNWTPFLPVIASGGTLSTYLENRYSPSSDLTCLESQPIPLTDCCDTASAPQGLTGACWLSWTAGGCIENKTAKECEAMQGVFLGFNTDAGDCPQ